MTICIAYEDFGITTGTFASVAGSRDGLSRWAACVANGPSLAGSAAALYIPLIIGMEGDMSGAGDKAFCAGADL
ncbi:MAG: hypothetical protein MUO68_19630, partial [Desulfobacteraceae bacterium]|nr:hypothetical protein [Desulfobacteraceae bacterium]